MQGIFYAIVAVLWIVFAASMSKAKGQSAKTPKPAKSYVPPKPEMPRAAGSSADGPVSLKSAARSVKAEKIIEKTHSHEGEVEGKISLSEDRKNDWLAKQIREENRTKQMLQ